MIRALFGFRYFLAFALAAPFFMAALGQVPAIFDATDRLIEPSGYSTADLRGTFGVATDRVLSDLGSRAGEFYSPSDFARKLDSLFPGADIERRVNGFDPLVDGARSAKNELLAMLR